jgi:outer membrane protein TolC
MKKYKKLLLIFIGIYVFAAGFAQQQNQDSLTQYLEIAVKNNPSVMQKLYEYQAALQKTPQVGSLPDPELNVGVFLSPMELIGGNQVADIKLMQMFPWFGVLKNAKDEMSLMAKGKFESFRDAKIQVFFEVKSLWYELYRVQENIRISEKNVGILKSLERISLMKFRTGPSGGSASISSANLSSAGASGGPGGSAGMQTMGKSTNSVAPSNGSGSRYAGSQTAVSQNPTASSNMQSAPMGSSTTGSGLTDIYRIQIETGDLENNIALLKNQQKTTMARFNSLLNRAVQSPVSLPDSLQIIEPDPSLFAESDSMFANNPMLGMLKYEQLSLDARKKMISRMGYPMVGIGVNYSLINKSSMSTSAMNGQDMIMPMVTVTLPVYRKKNKAMRTETDLMKSASEQGYKATVNSLQTEYVEAIQLFEDAKRRIQLYENQSLLAKKSLDIMIKSFSSSGAGLTDVLRIRQQTFDYEFKQIEAISDYNTAIARLERITCNAQIQ